MAAQFFTLCIVICLCTVGVYGAFPAIRSLGATRMQYAAFSHILHNSQTGKEDLVVSTFSGLPDTKDKVWVVRDIEKQVALNGGNNLPTEVLTEEFYWPNELGEVPSKYLSSEFKTHPTGCDNNWHKLCNKLRPPFRTFVEDIKITQIIRTHNNMKSQVGLNMEY